MEAQPAGRKCRDVKEECMSSKKQRRKKGRKSHAKRDNTIAMIAIALVVCLLCAALLYEGFRLKGQIHEADLRREALEQEIADETARTQSIESLREYMQSDEYVKQAAKDRLGLVESGEVVFKAQE